MNTQNKQQRSILITLSFYSVILFILIWVGVFLLYPEMRYIEAKKIQTNNKYTELEEVKTTWISLDIFKDQVSEKVSTPYEKQLVQNIDANTYQVFTHTGSIPYTEFLENLTQELQQKTEKSSSDSDIIGQILPIYGGEPENPYTLSDFKFVNYVESIFETFDLEYEWWIGIQDVVLVEDFSSEKNKNSLEASIFYIPLELKITGAKKSVLDFLHYVESTGKINIEGEAIELYSDNVLSLWRLPIILEWENYSPEYNIYKNPMIDIANIRMEDYLDSSISSRKEQSFIDFVRETRGNEEFIFDVTLHFYVEGLPQYKIQNKITQIVTDYNNIKAKAIKKRKSASTSAGEKIILDTVIDYLQSINSEIKSLQDNLAKQLKMETLYIEAQEFEKIFTQIQNKILPEEK